MLLVHLQISINSIDYNGIDVGNPPYETISINGEPFLLCIFIYQCEYVKVWHAYLCVFLQVF